MRSRAAPQRPIGVRAVTASLNASFVWSTAVRSVADVRRVAADSWAATVAAMAEAETAEAVSVAAMVEGSREHNER